MTTAFIGFEYADHRRPEHGIYYALVRRRAPWGNFAITGPFDTYEQAAQVEREAKERGHEFFGDEWIGVVELPDGPVYEGSDG